MAESYTQVAPNSTGNKMRTRSRTISANTVHEQAIFNAAADTWYALADAIVPASAKSHIAIFNATGSGKVIKVKKVFPINVELSSVTGVALRMEFKKCTAVSSGTVITPTPADSNNAALPSQVTVRTGGTITSTTLLWPLILSSEEMAANTSQLIASVLASLMNAMVEGAEVQELTLREGEGLTVNQLTSSTVGLLAWLLVFTIEDP